VRAIGGAAERMIPETEQRRLVHGRDQPHVAAVAPVSAVRAAPIDMGLAAPRDRPGSPVAGARMQLGLVDESGHGEEA